MCNFWRKFLWQFAGWLALAYLGYWSALFLEDLLVGFVVSPLLGAPVSAWRLTPLRAVVQNTELANSPIRATFLLLAPLLLQVLFLAAVIGSGSRIRSAFATLWLHLTSLWTILLVGLQVVLFVYASRGRLARLASLLSGQLSPSTAGRIAVTAAVLLLLLAASWLVAGRMVAVARSEWLPQRRALASTALLALPTFLIILAVSGILSAIRYVGWGALVYLLLPAGACLLFALLGLSSKSTASSEQSLSGRGTILALFVSATLYACLQHAAGMTRWAEERLLERASFAHYDVRYERNRYSESSVREFGAAREASLSRLAARLAMPIDHLRLRIVLYPNFPAKQAATGSMRPFTVEGKTIRAVLGGYVQELDPAADAAAVLDTAWGRPGSALLGNWVARWASGEWRGRSVDSWAAQIEAEIGHCTLAELLSGKRSGEISPLVRSPLGGEWINWVFKRYGLAGVQELYDTKGANSSLAAVAQLLGVAPAELELDWIRWVAQLEVKFPPQDFRAQSLAANFFFRGVSFSQEGWEGMRGAYASAEAAEQLRQIHSLNANAVALVPYGFVRDTFGAGVTYTETGETDEDVSQAAYVAHRLGMKVMVKPQLWAPRGEFTGKIRFDDDAQRARWMGSYREFILHYARLAELEHIDLLCIGNELEGVSSDEAAWRQLIAAVRRVYHGPLTYAANWNKEFSAVRFWDALDYAGLNNYHPLAATPSLRAEDLLPGADAVAEKLQALSRRWGKPVLFTEVGYPSVRRASVEPWIEDSGRDISLEEQAACYEATFRAFSGRPWFRGMFWWKWSAGGAGGPTDISYTPIGKPASDVIRAWYTRPAATGVPTPTQ